MDPPDVDRTDQEKLERFRRKKTELKYAKMFDDLAENVEEIPDVYVPPIDVVEEAEIEVEAETHHESSNKWRIVQILTAGIGLVVVILESIKVVLEYAKL
jgi:hypothetical protein